ncbi:hypothetical protein HU200_034833 [Digitaria exilis]|uniref:Uncharacterized protein n=1 Tax=Digitaria exilis TaxID=1010633 RepID=A0A835BJC7_9POAL|nr:hypothetical protein HU200_034833 [Digitaria exilis]
MNVALVDWFHELAGSAIDTAAKGTRSLAILIVWTVWCERNARIFNEQEKPIAKIIDDIKDTARLWGAAGAKHLAALVDRPISE